jgi:hypothetical protein
MRFLLPLRVIETIGTLTFILSRQGRGNKSGTISTRKFTFSYHTISSVNALSANSSLISSLRSVTPTSAA